MIRTIVNIKEISVIDQNIKNNIYSLNKIDYNDKELGSGGFGAVYKVKSIDGLDSDKYVLKIFSIEKDSQHAYDVISMLHIKIKKHQSKTNVPIFYSNSELIGLPFMVFKGYDDVAEKDVVAFIMYNLIELGYEDYGNEACNREKINELHITDKIILSFQIAKTIDFLHNINFLHCDLKEESLFINPETAKIAIIDFDSGYHFDKQDKALTVGSFTQWVSKKFNRYIRNQASVNDISTDERIRDEYWLLANSIFELIFGLTPYFFLRDASDEVKTSYLLENIWPKINYDSEYFLEGNAEYHKYVVDSLEYYKHSEFKPLIKAFEKTFNEGYSNDKVRLSSSDWKKVLYDIIKCIGNNPKLLKFSSSKQEIDRPNEYINFEWNVSNCNEVYVNGELQDLSSFTKQLKINDDKKVDIKLVNDFGYVEDSIFISANKEEPEILFFISSSPVRKSLDKISLSWNVKNADYVLFNRESLHYDSIGGVDIYPSSLKEYFITAVGSFGQKVTSSIKIDVIKPKINNFSYEVNLLKGIKNIDLKWDTENVTDLFIEPDIGKVTGKNIYSIEIDDKTKFILKAIGYFGTIEKEIYAIPFPLPIVRELMTGIPNININSRITIANPIISKDSISGDRIQFNNNINITLPSIDISKFKEDIFCVAMGTDENFTPLDEKLLSSIEKSSISDTNTTDVKLYKKNIIQIIKEVGLWLVRK